MDAAAYCREVETYLCRKNHGHLIRLVGPAFELVRGWADGGVPLKVVFGGIDARVARANTRSRRRSLRIEFCADDVLEQFDDWRRAVGVRASASREVPGDATSPPDDAGPARRRLPTLSKHLDRIMVRLTERLVAAEPWPGVHTTLDRTVRQVDVIRSASTAARGSARGRLLDELTALDREMMASVRAQADPVRLDALDAEARTELAPFQTRMVTSAFEEAVGRGSERLLREALGLPRLSLD